jgi:2,3-bisphosphoglycerate-dependent phosphoglycerate mutase
MPQLIILRHGQSEWNLQNRFTGIADIDLTEVGIAEARKAGQLIKSFQIDVAFTSILRRAIHTLKIVLAELPQSGIPVTKAAELDERDYGDLQGMDKAAVAAKYGDAQVLIWRRSFEIAPPGGESLQDTYHRVIPYYQKNIAPLLMAGKQVLIVAHGNSLRALMMYLENISAEAITAINLPTGLPRLYQFDSSLHLQKVYDLLEGGKTDTK